jgi:hypothetical protein
MYHQLGMFGVNPAPPSLARNNLRKTAQHVRLEMNPAAPLLVHHNLHKVALLHVRNNSLHKAAVRQHHHVLYVMT